VREKLTIEGSFVLGGPDLPFRYLPFEVPSGATRIEVSYHFERAPGQPEPPVPDDVLDVGVFDTRGYEFLSGGFRGWSGGARRQFFISRDEATPGYIRGPLQPGEWHILLGARINHSQRMPFAVHINIDRDPNAPPDEPPPLDATSKKTPRRTGGSGRWYKGDFHSHTVHSDGYNTIDEYVTESERVGLDFLAITDHNTTSHFEEIARRPTGSFLLIPGEEVTTFWGHANVWGAGCWVDFRATDDETMRRTIEWVHECGGLFSPTHPKASAGYPWEFGVEDFRTVETWQGAWRYYNAESLDFWEQRLRQGRRIVAVGGSDCHSIAPATFIHPWTVGNPCTWVYVEGDLDEEGVLDGVRAGHVFLSEDTTGPFLEMTATAGDRAYMVGDVIEAPAGTPVRLRSRYHGPPEKKLRLIRNGEVWQQIALDRDDETVEVELPLEEPGYIRAEVAGFRGRPERGEVIHALTNPLYLAVLP
jgi:hypothetical protein